MGHAYEAKCSICGHTFTLHNGGGFRFAKLRCDQCGKDKEIIYEEHKGQLQLLSEDDDYSKYQTALEAIAGECGCGGQYRFDAPGRCPECHSTDLADTGKWVMMYD